MCRVKNLNTFCSEFCSDRSYLCRVHFNPFITGSKYPLVGLLAQLRLETGNQVMPYCPTRLFKEIILIGVL